VIINLKIYNHKESIKVSGFSNIGKIHNDFLDNINSNFDFVDNGESVEEKIDVINNFNTKFVERTELSDIEKTELKTELEKHKDLVVTTKLSQVAFGTNSLKNGTAEYDNIEACIIKMKE
jgi:hypothetical protein